MEHTLQCSDVSSDGYTCVPNDLCKRTSAKFLDIRGGLGETSGLALCEDLSQICCHHTDILLSGEDNKSEGEYK